MSDENGNVAESRTTSESPKKASLVTLGSRAHICVGVAESPKSEQEIAPASKSCTGVDPVLSCALSQGTNRITNVVLRCLLASLNLSRWIAHQSSGACNVFQKSLPLACFCTCMCAGLFLSSLRGLTRWARCRPPLLFQASCASSAGISPSRVFGAILVSFAKFPFSPSSGLAFQGKPSMSRGKVSQASSATFLLYCTTGRCRCHERKSG